MPIISLDHVKKQINPGYKQRLILVLLILDIMVVDYQLPSDHTQLLWTALILIRNTIVGTVSVGLVMGACLLTHFLYRISRLPKKCRQYREMSYHLESETLLRYTITIACLLTLNILFYAFFETGKICSHIGVVVWLVYLAGGWARKKIKGVVGK